MNIEKLVRKNIKELIPYSSARDICQNGILMDANENPFGSVVEFSGIQLNRYPDSNHRKLRIEIAKMFNCKLAQIFCGAGSDEIIDLLVRIFCKPGIDNIITLNPTYGMYEVAANINDTAVNIASCSSVD